jgi:hypothetical protein
MTSVYFSNILTTTTSKFNNLRRQLISSEADGDTEDDSHIARVLRAYYTENQRSFPEWLPADPKAPIPQAPQFVSSTGQPGYGQGPQQPAPGGRTWGRGGLSDLWDGGNKQAPQEPESLRQRPGLRGSNNASFESQGSANSAPPIAAAGGGRFAQQSYLNPEPAQAGRPLPSQRAGSYQSQFSSRFGAATQETSPPPSAGSGSTAQERLKAKLWGAGRSSSPTQSTTTGSSASSPAPSSMSGRNPYETDNSRFGGASRGGGGGYQDSGRGGGVGGGGGGYGGGGSSKAPLTSANSPWSGGQDDYAGGGGGYESRPTGLPSGPRAGRQGMGLPSGPRPKR